jgi:long-chain acyl-CoA synthetase
MLSHANVVANVKACIRRLPATADDLFLSFLPLSHTFERTAGYYYPIAVGAAVAYARSTQQLPEDLKIVRPTILNSVPRIYERFYAKIMEHRASAGWLERTALDLTLSVGSRRFAALQGRGRPSAFRDRLVWPVLKRAVADKIAAQLGGRLRVAVSGGAPIAEPVIGLFLALGLDVLQGYGMTETSPVVAVNTPEENDPGTVGRPLDGIEVRIGENEELLVRGPSVMVGYWRKPEETRRVIEPDGWLHTGDQARIADGRITITGRIKDIIVTSTGEKVAPVDLETAIMADPLFEQVMVIGEQRQYLAVLAVLNQEEWRRALGPSQAGAGADATTAEEAQRALLLQRIATAVRAFPAYATPRAVWWTAEPWTIDAGLLTPTLKLKRPAMEQRFAREIAALYAGHRAQSGRSGPGQGPR